MAKKKLSAVELVLKKIAKLFEVSIAGKQDVIDAQHKLSADLITDGTTNKVINVKPDWNATSGDAFIQNKPVIPDVPANAVFTDTTYKLTIGSITNGDSTNGTSLGTLGTAALKDVPTSGNASSSQVVMGNDTRLTNSRTPTSHTHGNIQNTGALQSSDVTIANGDKLVITDSSDSNKVARASVAFDGSTKTKALTKNGTFETFVSTAASQGLSDTEKSNARANIGAGTSSFSGDYDDLNNKPVIPSLIGDDAARANWGGDWRMPTTEELQALGNAVNTAWTQVNNVYGILCTDKTDSSKTLFFPAAGYCSNGSVRDVGNSGSVWSSSLFTDNRQSACNLFFHSLDAYWDYGNLRFYGCAVRPILDGANANGHDYIEIGSIKWATMNIGANNVTDYGLYFAWGDVQGYTASQVGSGAGQKYFGWADYKYGNGTSSPGAAGMTKYNATDGLTTLELSTPVEYLHKIAVTGDYNDLSNRPDLSGMIETTYSNLVSLRNNSQLIPGKWYRITDYQCTTVKENTQSANHPFDIIVRADSVNVLNENAYAAKHAGDTYFANSNLAAWELKYCLDNDADRFLWADTTNGKGVIYRMIDEFNNECPYDFKNIQFKRWYTTDSVASRSGLNGYYMVANLNSTPEGLSVVDDTNFIFAYTFSSQQTGGTQTDFSLGGNAVHSNVIRPSKNGLNNIVFYGDNNYLNAFNYNCYDNTFGGSFFLNSFGSSCNRSSFGNSCQYNSFGYNCYRNSFGNSCQNNSFGTGYGRNSFGNNCKYNIFGNNCLRNSFGDTCQNNSFGNNCRNNSFGNNCLNNSLGNYCQYNSLDYSRYIIFENGNCYITLTSTQTTSSSYLLRNIKICQGVNNTTTTKTISHDTVNDTFQTEYKPANSQIISV